MTKNDMNQKFWAHLISVMVVALQEPCRLRLRFILFFKLKHVFTAPLLTKHTPNNLYSIMYYENNVQSLIKT